MRAGYGNLGDPLPLASRRLRLRRFRVDDGAAFLAYRSDPEVARYQGYDTFSAAEATAFVEEMAYAAFGEPGTWFQLAIAERDGDRVIGDIGLHIGATEPAHAEIGFSLNPRWQGRGLASEAVGVMLGWLLGAAGLDHVSASCDERNLASLRLLRRVGMVQVDTQEAVFKGEPCREASFELRRRHWAQS